MSAKKKSKTLDSEPGQLIPLGEIVGSIHVIRGEQVMFDHDLARLYQVETKRLVEAVKRNIERFPVSFMFQLTKDEAAGVLRSQIASSKRDERRGGRRTAPYAFTEQGVAMLSAVLRSKKAIQVSIAIMEAFVHMRRVLGSRELLDQVAALEQKYGKKFKSIFEALYEFKGLFEAVYMLLTPPQEPEKKRPIGFGAHDEDDDDA